MRQGSTGLFLHASSVVLPQGALLFLGHSTEGKSTVADLLATWYPLLADDAVFASRGAGGRWLVADGSFRFSVGPYTTVWDEAVGQVPPTLPAHRLLGCLRLHKSDDVRVAAVAPWENCRYLMDAALEVDLQRKFREVGSQTRRGGFPSDRENRMRRGWFGAVADIARNTPGWHLWFSRDRNRETLRSVIASIGAGGRPA